MRILYTGLFRFPDQDAAAARVIGVGKLLRLLGHKVFFLSWGGRKNDQAKDICIYQNFYYDVTFDLDCKNWIKKLFLKFSPGVKSFNYIKKNIDKYDVIISYNTPLIFNIRLNNLCNLYGKKLILDLTEWYSYKEQFGGYFSPFYWVNECNMKLGNHMINNKILISKFLIEYYKGEHNIQLPPLVDLNENKWHIELPFDHPLRSFKGTTFIYAGYISCKDKIDLFIKAVYALILQGEQIRFLILGTTKDKVGGDLIKIIDKIRDNVCFLGEVSQDLVPAYYKLADYSVLLRDNSRKNMAGFPTKFVESMSSGVPVLFNNCSDVLDYIDENNECVLVDSLSVNDIVKGIRKCIYLSNARKNSSINKRFVKCDKFDLLQWLDIMNVFISRLI